MSNNFAFYLKYRPQVLDELIGQEAVKKTLLSSFQNNKLSHAYLFVGPRGTGKTSTARILAKMVNCEMAFSDLPLAVGNEKANSQKLTASSEIPCNKCATCLSITDGSNMDLIEIDAASNRGIEDIRSLRDKIKLSPTTGKKKVYIIDEVHMLTPEAFNALLKTLEEPPAHALFVLATTEASKLPQTILSRVQRLDFKLAESQELEEALKKIIKSEKVEIDEEALKIIAKKAEGSFRDGVKLLDQLASMGEKITVKFVSDNFRSSQFENILDLIKNLKNKNVSGGLLSIGRQIESGVDIKQLLLSLMDILRRLVLIKNGVGKQLVKGLTQDKYTELETLAEGFENHDLIKDLDILQHALEKLKFTSIPSLPLELGVVEMCNSKNKPLDYFPLEKKLRDSSPAKPVQNDNIEAAANEPKAQDSNTLSADEVPAVDTADSDILKLKEKWTFVLETVRSFNFSLEALLRVINIKECTPTSVVLEVPYSFHQRILEAPKNRDLIEGVFSDILGRSIRISTKLGSRLPKTEDVANIEVAQDDEIIKAAAEIFNSDSIN